MDENEDYYSTSDLALATAISLFINIDHIDKANVKKVKFFFPRKNDKVDIEDLIDKYWKKQLRVEPSQYFYQIRTIKNLIYEA